MNFKRTISVLIAVVIAASALYVTPFYAIEEETAATEQITQPEETLNTDENTDEETTAPSETSGEIEDSNVNSKENSKIKSWVGAKPSVKVSEPEEKQTNTDNTTAGSSDDEYNTTAPTNQNVKKSDTSKKKETKKAKKKSSKYAELEIKGTTVYKYNKKVLKGINSYRKSKKLKKFKNDEALTKKAYARAAMLAVNYSKTPSGKTKISGKVIFTKGASYAAAIKAFKYSAHRKTKSFNACGIANLKVGSERLWVIIVKKKDTSKIRKITSYPAVTKTYKTVGDYYVKYFKAKYNTGTFKNKTVRYKKGKKYSGQLYLRNYKDYVRSYFKVDNSDKQTPVKYTSKNKKIATVTAYGNVKAKKPSAFKERTRYTPKKGDFILFHWYKNDGYLANHVGIVYKVTGNKVITIEGNTKNDNYRKSVVSKRTYKNYKKNSQIAGFMDLSLYMSRKKAESMADLAKKQIGKRGRNFYNHTKAWKEVNGSYQAAHWCAIFCGWLLEKNGYDPYDFIRWSPSCTLWIKSCHKRATAKIIAKVMGSSKTYSYKITFKA